MAAPVHTLICKAHLGFGIPCLRSLVRCSAEPLNLVVHEDGSLGPDDIEVLHREFQGCKVIRREEANEGCSQFLSKYPAIAAARKMLPHVIKLIDINIAPQRDAITRYVDSDVFFFKTFTKLFPDQTMSVTDQFNGVFSLDSHSSFGARVSDFWPVGPLTLTKRLNSGLFWVKRNTIDFDRMEFLFRRWGAERIRAYGGWFEQTVWADLAWRAGLFVFDPKQVCTAASQSVFPGEDTVAVHYVTPMRVALQALIRREHTGSTTNGASTMIRWKRSERFGIFDALKAAIEFRFQSGTSQ